MHEVFYSVVKELQGDSAREVSLLSSPTALEVYSKRNPYAAVEAYRYDPRTLLDHASLIEGPMLEHIFTSKEVYDFVTAKSAMRATALGFLWGLDRFLCHYLPNPEAFGTPNAVDILIDKSTCLVPTDTPTFRYTLKTKIRLYHV